MPQSTLDSAVVPFETRYDDDFATGNWRDPRYSDAADALAEAQCVTVIYDPYEQTDHGHVANLGTRVVAIGMPFYGHNGPRL